MKTGREEVARYFTLFVMLAGIAGLDQDATLERVMELMRQPVAEQIATYRTWILELGQAIAIATSEAA